MATRKQITANRDNATHSTGPQDTDLTRFNAMKHGLLASGITELDQVDYAELHRQLVEHFRPIEPIESWLVERIALCIVRLQRAVRLESDYIAGQIAAHKALPDPLDLVSRPYRPVGQEDGHASPGYLNADDIEKLNSSITRYETSMEKKFYQALHELERLQRQRRGEHVPAPAAGDLNINVDGSPGAIQAIPHAGDN